MFDIQSYYSFILAILLFQLIPGAGTIAILSATAGNGIKSGMSAVCGILLGDFIYMVSAVLGLAALLQQFPSVLQSAQYAGALYLCYLGLQKIFAKIEADSAKKEPNSNNLKIFKQSLAICLTNPKAIMFFMAFFPLFLSDESKPVTLVVMMFHVTIISFIYQSLLVLAGNSASRFLSKWKYPKLIATRLAGIALVAFGIKLARSIK